MSSFTHLAIYRLLFLSSYWLEAVIPYQVSFFTGQFTKLLLLIFRASEQGSNTGAQKMTAASL